MHKQTSPLLKRSALFRGLLLAGLGSLSVLPALAQEAGSGYGGLSVGQARSRIDEAPLIAGQLGAGITPSNLSRDRSAVGYKAYLGYQMTPSFALEAGYFNLGSFRFGSDTTPAGRLDGRFRPQGLNLDLVGRVPLGENFSVFGRVGGLYSRSRMNFDGTGAAAQSSEYTAKGTGYKAGLGVQYAISSSLTVIAEAERYRVRDYPGQRGNINMISVGLVLPFGHPTSTRHTETLPPPPPPAPVPVEAPPPAPAPVQQVMPPPPPPMPQRVTFSAESLFGFDKAVVRPEGRASLDGFVTQLRSTNYSQINVEGYTDRLGTSHYNQQLSQRRADAVKSYLVDKGGIDSGKISAKGMGESKPITKPEDCKGNKPSKTLISCLQPDRRVEIEVVGTR